MTNRALVMLYEKAKQNSNVEHILTNRLNQDVLEHFFGAIRSKGGLNDHPTPQELKYRLRKYILARNTECLQGRGNVSADTSEWLTYSATPTTSQLAVSMVTSQGGIDEIGTDGVVSEDNTQLFEMEPEVIDGLNTSQPVVCVVLHEDALEYISGYVIKKLNLANHKSSENTFTWVDQVSKGFLNKPSTHFLGGVKNLENIFHNLNALQISHCKNIHKQFMEKSADVELPESVKRLFYKCRIHFRVRNLNRRLKIKKAKQRNSSKSISEFAKNTAGACKAASK